MHLLHIQSSQNLMEGLFRMSVSLSQIGRKKDAYLIFFTKK